MFSHTEITSNLESDGKSKKNTSILVIDSLTRLWSRRGASLSFLTRKKLNTEFSSTTTVPSKSSMQESAGQPVWRSFEN